MPIYSLGEESPMKFNISHSLAENYNQAVDEWFKAQRKFMQKFGQEWDPVKDPIVAKWTRKQQKAWNEFAKMTYARIATYGPYHYSDITDDYLVLNGAEVAYKAANNFKHILTFAVAGGALYGYLRGR